MTTIYCTGIINISIHSRNRRVSWPRNYFSWQFRPVDKTPFMELFIFYVYFTKISHCVGWSGGCALWRLCEGLQAQGDLWQGQIQTAFAPPPPLLPPGHVTTWMQKKFKMAPENADIKPCPDNIIVLQIITSVIIYKYNILWCFCSLRMLRSFERCCFSQCYFCNISCLRQQTSFSKFGLLGKEMFSQWRGD